MTDGWREGPIFEDKGSVKLETLLNRFFAALYKPIVKQWKEAREAKVRREQERLAELTRAEAAKIRAEEESKAAAERRKRDALFAEAKKWDDAQRIRAYVKGVRGAKTGGGSNHGATGVEQDEDSDSSATWAGWALRVADDVDPTTPRRSDLEGSDGRSQMGRDGCGVRKDDS
jgi:hypothetical protein